MYDLERLTLVYGIKVKDLIEELSKYPQEAEVLIGGNNYCYIHVEMNNSIICLNNEPLYDCYNQGI